MARLKLTDEITEKVCSALRAGNYFDAACKYAGITERTGYNWLAKGRAAKSGQHFQFVQAVEKASGDAEVGTLAVLKQAMPKSWQAAAWWLERRFPKKWGRRTFTTVEGLEVFMAFLTQREIEPSTAFEAMMKGIAEAEEKKRQQEIREV